MFERGSDQSVLDLTWANQLALPLIKDWTVHTNLDITSDHLPITWSIPGKRLHNGGPPEEQVKFRFHPDGQDEWGTAFIKAINTNHLPL